MSRRGKAHEPKARAAEQGGGIWQHVATAGGLGRIPVAPGTAGSLLGAATCFPCLALGWPLYLTAAVLLAGIAVLSADRAAPHLGGGDPPAIVIDEVAGMWLAALAIPLSLYDLAAVFLLFRLFDAVKPAPLPRLERLPGGWGIVADDLAAGLLARAAWWLLQANFDFL
jgi:phosphatidylglycerophosphatase A